MRIQENSHISIEQRNIQRIQSIFSRAGFAVKPADPNEEPEINFFATKDNTIHVIKILMRNKPIAAHTVARFLEYCEQNEYTQGIIVSLNGFSSAALAISLTDNINTRIMLGRYEINEDRITFMTPETTQNPVKYISVFTQKGGVGKTTVAAHLAGAFALMGKSIALIDADPDQNLTRLVTPIAENWYIQVPNPKTKAIDCTVRIFPLSQWQEAINGKYEIIITDCSPTFDKNPMQLMQQTQFFVVPVQLSPLNLGEKADIFHRTQQYIRTINTDTQILALINDYPKDLTKDQKNLALTLKTVVNKIINEPRTHLINPQECAIRSSQLLANWGKAPNLAFINVAGKCHPREDFLKLADVIDNNEFNN